MIIRSGGKTVHHLISRPLSGWRAQYGDSHEGRVNLWAPGGWRKVHFAQRLISGVLTQRCHAGKKETLQEFLRFSSCCLTPGVMGQNQSSALEHQTIAGSHPAPASTPGEQGKGAKVSRRRGRPVGDDAEEWRGGGKSEVRGQSEGGKAILWSFKELLFHAKLKSHYKDYMAANNVRQISI